jgi:hypothetical protein
MTVAPTGSRYRGLLRDVSALSSEFRFVIKDKHQEGPQAIALMNRLKPHLIKMELVDEWPGTRLVGGSVAQVWRYKTNDLSVRILADARTSFTDWGGTFPEDLHFVRADGSPVLACTTSEDDVWLQLTDDEKANHSDLARLSQDLR